MSGKVQHEIPQLFLRGFLIPNSGGTEQVFVYRRGRAEPYISGIDRAAAEGYFYSKLSADGSKTLDDEITDYERRLDQLVAELRTISSGDVANSAIAAEVVTHLTTRNAHLRGAFTRGLTSIAEGARTLFGNQDNLLRLLGLDEAEPGPRFRERFSESLDQTPVFAQTGLPRPVLERIAFFFAKENFGSATDDHVAPILIKLKELEKMAAGLARDGHNRALSQSVAPDARVARLGMFEWRVLSTEVDLVLPDCAALCLLSDGIWHPLMMADPDDVTAVAMPLSSRTLLVGRTERSPTIDPGTFNPAAAACSQNYFLGGSRSDELDDLLPTLGARALTMVEDAVRSGVYELLPTAQPTQQRVEDSEASSPKNAAEGRDSTGPGWIAITFRGDFDEALRKRMAEVTGQIVAEACWTIPLDRLDGITFADDYAEGLRTLDRGFPAAEPVEPYQSEAGSGVAQAPTVLRDGVVKGHVVMDGALARSIIGEDPMYRAIAVHALVNQLALVGCTEIFDEAMPGVLLRPFNDGFDHDRQSCVWPGWHGYFAARASAAFNPAHSKLEAEILLNGLLDAQTAIPASRLAYRQHGDLGRLFREVLPRIAFVLEHAGDLLGHADGLGAQPLADEPELVALLDQLGLRNWIASYHRQLALLWDLRGEWTGFDEFLALNPNAERLLWQFGIFPWRTAEGEYRIEVPLATDAIELLKISAEALAKGALPQVPDQTG